MVETKTMKNGSSVKLPKAEKKMTDRYDLSIPCSDVSLAKESLQRQCDAGGIYPFKISATKSGVAVSFLRNPNEITQWKYTDIMMNIIKQLKLELRVTTIMMRRKQGIVNMLTFPEDIQQIVTVSEQQASEDDIQQLKKLEEDSAEFITNLLMQLDEGSDYDDRQHIESLKRIARENRAAEKKAKKAAEEARKAAEEAKKALEEKKAVQEAVEKTLSENCSEEQRATLEEKFLEAREDVFAAQQKVDEAETLAKVSEGEAERLEKQSKEYEKVFKIVEDKKTSKRTTPGQLMFEFSS